MTPIECLRELVRYRLEAADKLRKAIREAGWTNHEALAAVAKKEGDDLWTEARRIVKDQDK